LSDQSGVFEVTAFSEVLSVSQNLLEPGTAVLLRCDAKSEEGNIRLLANRVQALDVAVEKEVKGLLIYVNNEEIVAPLAKILSGNSPGNGHVTITLQSESQEIDVTLPDSYLINAKMRSAVKSLPGVIDVSDL
jgi:DNA polymerase-3 subunit alpha